jgi:hypothetical protein
MIYRLPSLIAILFLFSTHLIHAQISLDSQDILNMIGNVTEAEIDTSGNIPFSPGPAGENQTWDFTSTTISGYKTALEFITPDGTPFEDNFPGANFVLKSELDEGDLSGEVYSYHNVSTENFSQLGIGIISGDFNFLQPEDQEVVPLPLEYGKKWTVSSSDTMSIIDGFYTVENSVRNNHIDAYGILKTPAGEFASLRIREEALILTETYVNNIMVTSDTTRTIYYEWIGENSISLLYAESPNGATDQDFDTAKEFGWATKVNVTSVGNEFAQTIPQRFKLNQNYPNPFNPETIISYSLPQNAEVSISIYDITGQLINRITPGLQTAGTHEIRWQAANHLASGAYMYQIEAGEFVATKKMILLR